MPSTEARLWTRQEFHRMADLGVFGEQERLELLEGEILMMPPQEPMHAALSAAIAQRLGQVYGPHFRIRQHSPLVCSDHDEPEPDIAVVPITPAHRERHPRGDEARLVVEIIQSRDSRDRRKISIYARAGVSAFWFVDITTGLIETYGEAGLDGERSVHLLGSQDTLSVPGYSTSWTVAELLGP